MRFVLRFLKVMATLAVVGYVGVCAFMWHYQRNLMYMPTRTIGTPQQHGLADFTSHSVTASDGTKLQLWSHPAMQGYPTILYFHGNGGNLSHRAHYFRKLADAGFGVIGLDYRGYGASEGEPSEEGFYEDARAAVAYAKKTQGLRDGELIIYGESIGSGVATQMASEMQAGALVLHAPFDSLPSAAQVHYGFLPVSLLIKDRYNSAAKMEKVRMPVLFFHGEQDVIVPISLGKALFAKALEPKEAEYFPDAGHNDMDTTMLTARLIAFSKKYALIQK